MADHVTRGDHRPAPMDLTLSPDVSEQPPTRPLTELILGRLGGPRWLWITIWALVPLVSPIVVGITVAVSRPLLQPSELVDLAATQVGLAWACLIFLWGGASLGRHASSLRVDLPRMTAGDESATDLFRGVGEARGPLIVTAAIAALVSANTLGEYGPLAATVALAPLVVYMLPIATFVWVDLVILVDLNRLGRSQLVLDRFPEDRTLGLDRLGTVASTGLGLLLVAALPIFIAGSDEPVTLALSLTVMALTVASFMAAMWGLHRQMAGAKARYVAVARGLYADAYAPLREQTTIEVLEARSTLLSTAQALEERASGLMTWPLDEGTLRFVVVMVTGIVTGVIVRAVFAALGF